MIDLLFSLGGVIVVIFILVAVVRLIERGGPLFTGPATPRMRIIALLLGILFGGLFLWELISSETFRILWPILAIALISYSAGAYRLLRWLQGDRTETKPSTNESEHDTPQGASN